MIKHSITATIEGNVFHIRNVGELQIHTILTYYCASYSVSPGPFAIALYLACTETPYFNSKHKYQKIRSMEIVPKFLIRKADFHEASCAANSPRNLTKHAQF